MHGKHEIHSENAKFNIRNLYSGKRAEAGDHPVLFNLALEKVVRVLLQDTTKVV